MCLTSRAEQRVHPHLLCGHSAGRFDAGLDLLLAHQNEFATIASAWRDADCSHTDRTVVEDLRRGQHHLAGSPREMGPDQERIAEGRSSASSHFAFPTLRWPDAELAPNVPTLEEIQFAEELRRRLELRFLPGDDAPTRKVGALQ